MLTLHDELVLMVCQYLEPTDIVMMLETNHKYQQLIFTNYGCMKTYILQYSRKYITPHTPSALIPSLIHQTCIIGKMDDRCIQLVRDTQYVPIYGNVTIVQPMLSQIGMLIDRPDLVTPIPNYQHRPVFGNIDNGILMLVTGHGEPLLLNPVGDLAHYMDDQHPYGKVRLNDVQYFLDNTFSHRETRACYHLAIYLNRHQILSILCQRCYGTIAFINTSDPITIRMVLATYHSYGEKPEEM